MKLWLLTAASLLLLCCAIPACKKAGGTSPIPHIEFLGLQRDTVAPGSIKDTVYLAFHFTDGDGDLGNPPQSGKYDVFLKDSRDSAFAIQQYFFPDIPDDAIDPIDGLKGDGIIAIRGVTIPLRADTLHVRHGDTLTYRMWVKDRADHSSDTITTTPIYIGRQ